MSTFGAGNYVVPPPATLTWGGFWIRAVAYLIDAIVLNVVLWVLAVAVSGQVDPTADIGSSMAWGTAVSGSFLVPAIYTIGFWITSGATPGKMAFGMQVVDAATGTPVTAGQAIGRFFAYIVSGAVFCLGFIWIGLDARKQGWHDKLASTVVVRRI